MDNNESFSLSAEEKRLFSQMIINLSMAFVQAQMFGIEHQFTREPAERAVGFLRQIISKKGDLVLYIAESRIKYGPIALEEKNLLVQKLVNLASKSNLVSLRFKQGFTAEDLFKILEIFSRKPEEILSSGGVERLAQDKGISTIEVNPLKYELIGKDQKTVSESAKVYDLDAEEEMESSEEEQKKKAILALIKDVLKKDTSITEFLGGVKESPVEMASSIAEAFRLMDKLGMEAADPVFSSLFEKIGTIKEDIFSAMVNNKEYDMYEQVSALHKALSQQLDLVPVSEEIKPLLENVKNINQDIGERLKAYSLLKTVSKENIKARDKKNIAKAVSNKNVSDKFSLLLTEVLKKRGFSEDEINLMLQEGMELLTKKKSYKELDISKEIKPILNKNLPALDNFPELAKELDEKIEDIVNKQIKVKHKKLKEERDILKSLQDKTDKVLDKLDKGIVILDEIGRVHFINQKALGILGIAEGKVMDRKLLDAVAGRIEPPEEFKDVLQRVVLSPQDEQGNIIGLVLE